MKMNFDYDNVNAMSNAFGSRIQLLEELIESNGLSEEQINAIVASDFQKDFIPVYGFHIDSNESDPSEAVTYLADAIGMKPAFMDYSKGEFNYGSWEDAFFMPRPCMLKYDGTVDYYLDPNDYSKKEDGTDSDVADFEYGGNAMMEWGRNGRQIWYKIVPDPDDNTSASIYFCEYKLDDGFHAWSFINNQGVLVDHFYTPIYNGTLDTNGKLRSISGKAYTDLCMSKTPQQEVDAAELNNPGEDKLWYTETFADSTLINLLLVLMGKCLNTQLAFGNGISGKNSSSPDTNPIGTGTMDAKGLFYGDNSEIAKDGVKVFGMENWWGNVSRIVCGLNYIDGVCKYKMTRGTEDGSLSVDYNINGENYLDSGIIFHSDPYMPVPMTGGSITKHLFNEIGGMFPYSFIGGSPNTYYCDSAGITTEGLFIHIRGGTCNMNRKLNGAFTAGSAHANNTTYKASSCLSCKPLAQSN